MANEKKVLTNCQRLIDANAIPYEEHYVPDGDTQWQYKKELCVLKPTIDAMPTMDAVEVCRCKDCRWFDKAGYEEDNAHEDDLSLHMGWCADWRRGTQACGFCSHGERREGE